MIQYNNFLMKREQSRAGSRFAECEKSRLKAKILITLALLLTAVTGAWAQTVTVTWTLTDLEANPDVTTFTKDGVTLECADRLSSGKSFTGPLTFSNTLGNFTKIEITGSKDAPTTAVEFTNNDKVSTWTGNAASISITASIAHATQFVFTIAPAEPPLTVEWNASTKTGTFSMPGSDVVLTPQYAPAAQLDKDGEPAAVSGLEIAADAAIITAGQSAQGTLLYAVTTSAEAPALTAFSAALPNAKDQTAAGNYYVWYYIQGHDTPDGQEPSADNTFNDSEIMGPVTVELLTNEHTLNIKQSPNITVTVAGTAKTPTDDKVTPVTTGQEVKIKAKEGYKFRKVEGKKHEVKN